MQIWVQSYAALHLAEAEYCDGFEAHHYLTPILGTPSLQHVDATASESHTLLAELEWRHSHIN
jgi:hypothetical protein